MEINIIFLTIIFNATSLITLLIGKFFIIIDKRKFFILTNRLWSEFLFLLCLWATIKKILINHDIYEETFYIIFIPIFCFLSILFFIAELLIYTKKIPKQQEVAMLKKYFLSFEKPGTQAINSHLIVNRLRMLIDHLNADINAFNKKIALCNIVINSFIYTVYLYYIKI